MRILLLNFAYGIGPDGSNLSYITHAPKFFYAGRSRCMQLAELIRRENPDLVTLVEIDGGSMRAGFVPQWQEAASLNYSAFAESKYFPGSIWNKIPILKMHMNAILTKKDKTIFDNQALYFSIGMKRLVLRQTINNEFDIYVVHLALDSSTRALQLDELAQMIIARKDLCSKVVVSGDFNAFNGRSEFASFLNKTGLKFGSSEPMPTFPAYKPKQELDFVLVSPDINIIHYKVLPDVISDHLAILIDIL